MTLSMSELERLPTFADIRAAADNLAGAVRVTPVLRDDRLESLMKRLVKTPEGRRVRATSAMADSLSDLVRSVWRNIEMAGEAGNIERS